MMRCANSLNGSQRCFSFCRFCIVQMRAHPLFKYQGDSAAAMNGQNLVAVQPFPLDFLKDALPQTASEALSANL